MQIIPRSSVFEGTVESLYCPDNVTFCSTFHTLSRPLVCQCLPVLIFSFFWTATGKGDQKTEAKTHREYTCHRQRWANNPYMTHADVYNPRCRERIGHDADERRVCDACDGPSTYLFRAARGCSNVSSVVIGYIVVSKLDTTTHRWVLRLLDAATSA